MRCGQPLRCDAPMPISQPTPSAPPLEHNDIHLRIGRLDRRPDELAPMKAMLSRDETERAARFRFEDDRSRFIASRAIVRQLLTCTSLTNRNRSRWSTIHWASLHWPLQFSMFPFGRRSGRPLCAASMRRIGHWKFFNPATDTWAPSLEGRSICERATVLDDPRAGRAGTSAGGVVLNIGSPIRKSGSQPVVPVRQQGDQD